MADDSESDYKKKVAFLMSYDYNKDFQALFAQPPADFSSTVRASPLSACEAEAIALALLLAAEANPLSIDVSVQSLVVGLSTTEDIIYTDEDSGSINTHTVLYTLGDCLADVLLGPQQTVVSRKNSTFPSALLAASAMRNGLLGLGMIGEFVNQGLQLPGSTTVENKKGREDMAIGVCLVLLVDGNVLADMWRVYDVEQLGKVVKVEGEEGHQVPNRSRLARKNNCCSKGWVYS